ncbi:Ger(x)C family spore germination C-terminal domain-containing protein [Paenibacillus sp. QZ-Y1]|uniref:Ger(x)C family spore germination C-terminal domain-containing protein n=1 Tax=Paenibacillus sp. QZ-Y1 TaxID=3414511 RepID=UPI003F795906
MENKTSLTPHIINKEWSMQIRIESQGEVVLNTTDEDLSNPAKLTKLEQAWSAELKEHVNEALQMSQRELKTDFFKFAVEFRRYYPKQWKEQQQNWEKIFSEMNVDVKVEALVVRTGKSIGPQGIPDQGTK